MDRKDEEVAVMTREIPTVAIVGRTNVGKSTLFNALAKRRLAIVEDQPGVTRDRNYALITQYEAPFFLIDTGGLVGEDVEDAPQEILDSVRQQAEIAVEQSDLVLAVFDGLAGVHPQDQDVCDFLRRSGKDVIWIINKCEKPISEVLAADFYQLGIPDYHSVSAAHRIGINELARMIHDKLELGSEDAAKEGPSPDGIIRVAVLGRPNVGKSTMINKILGEDRLITSDMPGTTRDSIDTAVTRDGQRYLFIDTAGLRKKGKVDDLTIERFANLRTLKSLARCDVAVLVLDATQGLPSEQEQKIASLINERGKGLVLVVNKWDAVEKDHRTVKEYEEAVYSVLNFARYAPLIFTSAITGRRCPNVLKTCREVCETSKTRIKTSELNRILERAFANNTPPIYRGEPVKFFFAAQIDVAPPTIVLFVNNTGGIRPSYLGYLKKCLRENYPFEGSDVKFITRKRTQKAQKRFDREQSESGE